MPGHKFTGYYFTYPSDAGHRGLVSTIADDPPMLNWIYVDKDSGEVCHGGRKDTLEHLIGPWGWSPDETWLTYGGEETGFIAVESAENKKWVVCLDRDGSRATEDDAGRPADPAQEAAGGGGRCQRWTAIRLRRKMVLGMESRYVRPSEKASSAR